MHRGTHTLLTHPTHTYSKKERKKEREGEGGREGRGGEGGTTTEPDDHIVHPEALFSTDYLPKRSRSVSTLYTNV